VITLVFSSSLIGVAVDYSILMTAKRLSKTLPRDSKEELASLRALWEGHRALVPAMAAVLIAPAVAYGGMMALPCPGLKQMALFAVLGIAGAWTTVMLAYPYLLRKPMKATGFASGAIRFLQALPVWRASKIQIAVSVVLLFAIGFGISKLSADDDIRHLINTDPELIKEQIEVSRLMQLPSPAQMFLIMGKTPEQVLAREEGLIERLKPFIASGAITGSEHITRWLPSAERQKTVQEARMKLRDANLKISADFGLSEKDLDVSNRLLTAEDWLNSAVAPVAKHLWLQFSPNSYASIVLLKGLHSNRDAEALSKLAGDGVTWVNKTRDISELMKTFRERLSWVIGIAYLLVPIALFAIYKRKVWRVVLPSLLATLATLAAMGYLHVHFQMIAAVALLLVFGMGMDYGLFLVSQDKDPKTLLSISVAALLTIASFGLLALSSMPVLETLGVTVTAGVLLAWFCMLFFRSKTG
jgi:predicted exporter